MILNVPGVVLSRRNIGEADRLAVLFTETLGKITVRFNGVNKSQSKLKALSEPLVWGEYRLYLSPKSEFGKIIGGRIIDSFPALRDDWRKTVEALGCCEILSSLTADRNPNPEKYRLICEVLTRLSHAEPDPWLSLSFGLRILDEAGLRPEETSILSEDRAIFDQLLNDDFPPFNGQTSARLRGLLYGRTEAQLGRPVKSRLFMESVSC